MTGKKWLISIAYDSPALPGFEEGWGFSALVRSEEGIVLFDCGWDGRLLKDNLSRLGSAVSEIDRVVISHSHWDHIGGLPAIVRDPEIKRSLEVIVPAGFSRNLQNELGRWSSVIEVSSAREVQPGIWATGPLGGEIAEQALVLRGESGAAVLTGCGHPGLDAVLAGGSMHGHGRHLIGGLHDCGLAELERSLGENPEMSAVLCHCTRCKAEALAAMPRRVRIGAAGEIFEVRL
jgi:7,8-dihydropterin-6-yl-methyl-4-(beta-D-ribofuranosyl)aminobenzene 5'-phosphate synthase